MTQGATVERVAGRTLIMGVLNATPDSFYPPSSAASPQDICAQAQTMAQDGADIIDIGGESSRPGSEPVSAAQEQARVLPLLEALDGTEITISVDTYRASTALEAMKFGVAMINDITALRGDPEMAGVIADAGAECVLMHMQGMPNTMQDNPKYDDVIDDICAFFEERIAFATCEGVPENKIWLDPGFGFGKTVRHNLTILRRLGELKRFGLPLVIGTSNKSTIGAVLNTAVDDRTEGTAATVALAIYNGADCVRVHDVKSMSRVARMTDAITGKVQID